MQEIQFTFSKFLCIFTCLASFLIHNGFFSLLLKGSVLNKKQIVISGASVLAGRNYWCYLVMSYDIKNDVAGNVTSARSQSILMTTLERKSKLNICLLFLFYLSCRWYSRQNNYYQTNHKSNSENYHFLDFDIQNFRHLIVSCR